MDRTFKLLLILGLVGGIAYFTKDKWYPTVQTWVDGKGVTAPRLFGDPAPDVKTLGVKRVQVIRADQFDLVLEDDSRVMAKLKVSATDSAKPKVIDLLNRCQNPKVRLVQKQPDGTWLVDFLITESGKEVDLAAWLSDKKLVFK